MNDGKPSSQRPTQSLTRRLRNSSRCAASCMSAANCACARPMSRNASAHTNQVVDPHRGDDDPDRLRVERRAPRTRCAALGMRRSSSRHGGAGRALAARRSVGRKSVERLGIGQHRRGGHGLDVTFLRQMTQERNAPTRSSCSTGRSSPRSLIGSLLLGMRPPRMPARPARGVVRAVRRGRGHGPGRAEPDGRAGRADARPTACTSWPATCGAASPRRTGASRPSSTRGTASGCSASSSAGAADRRGTRRRCATPAAGCGWSSCAKACGRRPDNLPRAAAPAEAWARADAQCAWWSAGPTPTRVARRDRAVRARTRGRTRARDAARPPRGVDRGGRRRRRRDASPTRSSVGAAALAHVRADPLLPAELCGPRLARRRAARRVPRVPVGVLRRGARVVPQAVT